MCSTYHMIYLGVTHRLLILRHNLIRHRGSNIWRRIRRIGRRVDRILSRRICGKPWRWSLDVNRRWRKHLRLVERIDLLIGIEEWISRRWWPHRGRRAIPLFQATRADFSRRDCRWRRRFLWNFLVTFALRGRGTDATVRVALSGYGSFREDILCARGVRDCCR